MFEMKVLKALGLLRDRMPHGRRSSHRDTLPVSIVTCRTDPTGR